MVSCVGFFHSAQNCQHDKATHSPHSLPGAPPSAAWQCLLVYIGAEEGPLLGCGVSGFPSVMLKRVFQAFTVCHVSHTCKADTISFDR